MINFLKKIREKINIFLYDSRSKVLSSVRSITFITAVISMGFLIYYHGFPQPYDANIYRTILIKFFFSIFFLNYLIRLFYAFDNISFIKQSWFEGVLIFLLFIDAGSFYILNYPLFEKIFNKVGIPNVSNFYTLFIHFYILILVGLEIIKASGRFLSFYVKPPIIFLLSFLALITMGVILLEMPAMTVAEGSMPFLDALFTSVSATCVTGLIVVDTATYFTFKGQLVILILMQMGGIGIISFASFFAFYLKKGGGLRHQTAVKDFLSTETLYSTRNLFGQILFYTFSIELVGFFFIFSLWSPEVQFNGLGEKIFYSVFHSVSAFCNAGFSLFSNGLYEDQVRSSYILHLSFIILIVLGGLGFPALKDLMGWKNVRRRLVKPWMQWKTSTQVAIYASLSLIIFGSIIFYLLEQDNLLEDSNYFEAAVQSLFQSVTTRTAGFNTVDISALTASSYIFIIFLMFIGGSSGSTAGGIKTSTFVLIMIAVFATIRGKKELEISRRSISYSLLNKAFTIFVFSSLAILFFTFLLSITEAGSGFTILQIVFEEVSAFSTVGLTTGITSALSPYGKVIIILSMYIGRLGTLTLAFALSSPVETTAYKYPNSHLMIG